MSTIRNRMALCEAVLAARDKSPGFFVERLILDAQFEEIEAEILQDPRAFEPWLSRCGVN